MSNLSKKFLEKTEIEKKLFEILSSETTIEKSIDNIFDCDFETIGIDSMSFIKLVTEIERFFQIQFEDECLLISAYKKVGDFVSYIEKRIKKD